MSDMPVFLTPYFLIEGSIAEVIDCMAETHITTTEDNQLFTYRSTLYEDDRTNTMHGALNIYADYNYSPSTDQLVGWLVIERVRSLCHLEMRAIAEHQQLACDVLLVLPGRFDCLGPVKQTMLRPHSVLQELRGNEEPPTARSIGVRDLGKLDQDILDICSKEPGLTLSEIGSRIGLSEGATGEHYRVLVKLKLVPPMRRGRRSNNK
jgi:hypothetical protein